MEGSERRKSPRKSRGRPPEVAAKEGGSDAFTCVLCGEIPGTGFNCRDSNGKLLCQSCPVAQKFFYGDEQSR